MSYDCIIIDSTDPVGSADECKQLTSDFGITRYDLDTIKSLVIYISLNPDSKNFQGDKMTSEHLKSLGILQ